MAAARSVVQVLLAAGVRFIVISPGSRNAPLSYAIAEAEHRMPDRLRALVRIDERSAGFTAVGLALETGAPVALVTTSGTAVGNLMPAVMEADHAGVPLLVLSADRPAELRGTGANQTTDQLDLFGSHVRFAADIDAGTDPGAAVQTAVDAAIGLLEGVVSGPVQINLSFRDPLTPATEPLAEPVAKQPVQTSAPAPVPEALPQPARRSPADPVSPVAMQTTAARRTVVLAGHDAGPEAEAFARELGLPLLAEPSSRARFGPQAIGPYRLLLEHFAPEIERLVIFGRPALSRPVSALVENQNLPRARYLPRPVPWLEPERRSEQFIASLPELADFAGHGAPGWSAAWQDAARSAEQALDGLLREEADSGSLSGLLLAREVWHRTAGRLLLGSSNPIRDTDLAGTPGERAPLVFANRGLSGIDGTVSTATGIAIAGQAPVRVLLGDLTLLHDAGGMLLPRGEQPADLQLVVLNDAGGGIFSLLEHGALGEQPEYRAAVEKFFGTSHSVDFAALAAAYGWEHRMLRSRAELVSALDAQIRGRSVLELRVDRAGLRPLHERVRAAVLSNRQGWGVPGAEA
ncbi:2-succinyl-5-enolpyruvyl-6-hydroxy-3-cyclohexene-1-carboxylic-acid synthase [Acaricomes phytoseiuli]|uniref:2-succinyl-5-enolpyruvyl-6-hydroxy-3- cyclohexene-1-carboxylic-acid synthase n=1 Tax=Acaricomes phytoseiuli TaxID=291968 RepID=UPI0012EA1C8A|nr:2-succinyl-5-enolpyruvyl-6-hydroxy-3-cyclohexene-1-carboxylic-acid synthase [Acaricomes phytoseiuli]